DAPQVSLQRVEQAEVVRGGKASAKDGERHQRRAERVSEIVRELRRLVIAPWLRRGPSVLVIHGRPSSRGASRLAGQTSSRARCSFVVVPFLDPPVQRP